MQVDKFGNTPLHYCSTEVSMNAAVELLRFGPKQQLYVTNNKGLTPITALRGDPYNHLMYLTLYLVYDTDGEEESSSTTTVSGSGQPA